MQDNTSIIEPLLEKLEEYGVTGIELIKLKSVDKTAGFLSGLASRGFALLTVFLFILLANVAVAIYIGDLLGKPYYGFFCVAGFYVLLGFVLYFIAHKWIKKWIGNSIVSELLD